MYTQRTQCVPVPTSFRQLNSTGVLATHHAIRGEGERKRVVNYSLAPVGQVQAHDAVVGVEDGGVGGKVGGRAGVGLDVHPPQGRVQTEGLQGSLLAQQFNLVHHLRSSVVPGHQRDWGGGHLCFNRRVVEA